MIPFAKQFEPLNAALQKRAAASAKFARYFDAAPAPNSVSAYLRNEANGTLLFEFLANAIRLPPPTLRNDAPSIVSQYETTQFAVWFRGATLDLDVFFRCDPLSDGCTCDKCEEPAMVNDVCVLLDAVLANFIVDDALLSHLRSLSAKVTMAHDSVRSMSLCETSEEERSTLEAFDHERHEATKAAQAMLGELCRQPCFLVSRHHVARGLAPFEIRPGHEEAAAAGRPFALVRTQADEALELQRRKELQRQREERHAANMQRRKERQRQREERHTAKQHSAKYAKHNE